MQNSTNNLRVLMEMRPALDGFYGIPQETRLLYGVLSTLPELELSGLLQMSKRGVRGGVYRNAALSEAERVHRFARVVVSLKGRSALDWKGDVVEWLDNLWQTWRLRYAAWTGLGRIPLGHSRPVISAILSGRSCMAEACPPPTGSRCCAVIIGSVPIRGGACIWWVSNGRRFCRIPVIRCWIPAGWMCLSPRPPSRGGCVRVRRW